MDNHAGQAGGLFWLFVHPTFQFAVYAFLFTIVFKVRIDSKGPEDYLMYLFAGLGPWLLTQDMISRSSNVMISNQNIVKKVMIPAEVLVVKTMISSFFVQSILMGLVVGYHFFVRRELSPMMAALPVLMFMHISLLWGLALLLSSLAPYFRDISEFIRVFLTVNIYLIPIMYLPNMIPELLRGVLILNPFSHLVWCYQDVFYFGEFRHPLAWGVMAAFSLASVAGGSYVFVRLRHHFASML